jgi:hypothetical protein
MRLCGSRGEPRNRARADVVAAREFRKRNALRPSSAGLGLLCRGQFRRSAHMLPTGERDDVIFPVAGAPAARSPG